jgi:hypothetical protein
MLVFRTVNIYGHRIIRDCNGIGSHSVRRVELVAMVVKLASVLLLGAAVAFFAAWQWLPTHEYRSQQQPVEPTDLAALKEKVAELDRQYEITSTKLAELELYLDSGKSGEWSSSAGPSEFEALTEAETEVDTDGVEVFLRAIAGIGNRTVEQIEASGLSVEEYETIEAQAQQMHFTAFETEWLQRREHYQRRDRNPNPMELLRESIGDDAYDRYLYANGRSNRVKLHRVRPGSAAEQARLSPGDVVLSYDDKRVFSFSDLNQLSYEGEPGEPVVLKVKGQDGIVSQIVIPRGPMVRTEYSGRREVPGN